LLLPGLLIFVALNHLTHLQLQLLVLLASADPIHLTELPLLPHFLLAFGVPNHLAKVLEELDLPLPQHLIHLVFFCKKNGETQFSCEPLLLPNKKIASSYFLFQSSI